MASSEPVTDPVDDSLVDTLTASPPTVAVPEPAAEPESETEPTMTDTAAETTTEPVSDVIDPQSFLYTSEPAMEFALASPPAYTLTATRDRRHTFDRDDAGNADHGDAESQAQSQPQSQTASIDDAASRADSELYQLPSDHPLLSEANAQLTQSLKEKDSEVSTILREKLHALASLETRRTDLGVSLYSAQQELAKQQIALEKQQRDFQRASDERVKKEAELATIIDKQALARRKAEDTRKQHSVLQSELDELRSLRKRIETYEAQVSDEITVAKSVTAYTETMIGSAEKAKNAQDEAIADVNERVEQCQAQLAIVGKQIDNQETENQAGETIIKELKKELELISIEQKEFRSRWKLILATTQNRQDAIGLAHSEIDKVKEEIRSLTLLHAGTKHSIKRTQEEHAKLSEFNSRLEGEHAYLSQQTELIHDLSGKYIAQFDLIAGQLTTVEEELRRQNAVNQRLDSEVAAINNEVDSINRKRVELEDEKAAKIDSEITIEKGSEQIYRALRKSKRAHDTVANDLAEVENEIARVSIDLINTDHQCQQLTLTHAEYEKEIKEKDLLISKYNEEQDKRHDLIAKKQLTVTRINKELEKIIEMNAQSEFDPSKSGGHLDIQIRRVKRNREELIRQKEEQQREWIKGQARVVATDTENAAIAEETKQLQAKQLVLQHQSRRLASEIIDVARAKSQLDSAIRAMANGGQKMNAWIAELTQATERAEDKNRSKQQEFVVLLKEKQAEAQALEQSIVGVNREVEALKADIIANEFSLLQWKQKIAVELETQELLDPNVGLEEIQALKKDTAALDIAINEARKSLELAKSEMANRVKQTIDARCVVKPINTKQKINAERASLKQHIDQTKRNYKQRKTELSNVRQSTLEMDRDLDLVRSELQRQQLVFNEADERAAELGGALELRGIELRIVKEQTIAAQKRAQKMEEKIKAANRTAATPGHGAVSVSVAVEAERAARAEKLKAELARNDETFSRLVHIVTQVAAEQPRHRAWAQRLLTFV